MARHGVGVMVGSAVSTAPDQFNSGASVTRSLPRMSVLWPVLKWEFRPVADASERHKP
jgi:hypothetical protein